MGLVKQIYCLGIWLEARCGGQFYASVWLGYSTQVNTDLHVAVKVFCSCDKYLNQLTLNKGDYA